MSVALLHKPVSGDLVFQTVLNKDDAVQTDNVNFEGENEEANKAQFERSKL